MFVEQNSNKQVISFTQTLAPQQSPAAISKPNANAISGHPLAPPAKRQRFEPSTLEMDTLPSSSAPSFSSAVSRPGSIKTSSAPPAILSSEAASTPHPESHQSHFHAPPGKPKTQVDVQAPRTSRTFHKFEPKSPSTMSPSSSSSSSTTTALDNKICQWYCCSCGQSYGSVLYKHDYDQKTALDSRHHHHHHHPHESQIAEGSTSFASTTSAANINPNYIFDSLKYYSSVVYRDHKHAISNSPTLTKASSYIDLKLQQQHHEPRRNSWKPPSTLAKSPVSQKHKNTSNEEQQQKEEEDEEEEEHAEGQYCRNECSEHSIIYKSSNRSPPQTPPQPPALLSPSHLHLDLISNNKLIEYQDRVILNIPTRFTCHRCDHMMCPYCLKLRLKDIDSS
ncbi:uncharacterized protein LODBEIA_P21300 [Lodderomyces beijingensis]|uniref:Uncharacterized protein n=1 Tax=Lodderomyces beijingensis TaxID=1775926 RepID=A0ABP0ZLX6_9ASCO